jgi:methyl-accepting chemotaxis protein
MGSGTSEVKIGAQVVNKAGNAFNEIVTLVEQVSGQVKGISSSIHNMASGSAAIVTAVRQIDQISRNTAGQAQSVSAVSEEQSASIEEIAASSQNLSRMAQELQNAVGEFKI